MCWLAPADELKAATLPQALVYLASMKKRRFWMPLLLLGLAGVLAINSFRLVAGDQEFLHWAKRK